MSSGKAHGENRDYQILGLSIVQVLSRQEGLIPYEGDGIDVPFEMGGSTWTLDIALKNLDDSKIVVGECRRWAYPIEQEHIAAFAYKVELLRKHSGKEVAGVYLTKTHYRIGAVKAAAGAGIEIAICGQNQSPENFVLTYQKYDPKREARFQNAFVHTTETAKATASVSIVKIRADDTIGGLEEYK